MYHTSIPPNAPTKESRITAPRYAGVQTFLGFHNKFLEIKCMEDPTATDFRVFKQSSTKDEREKCYVH
jgi:hypothetical protein